MRDTMLISAGNCGGEDVGEGAGFDEEKFLEEVNLQYNHLLIIHFCIEQIFIETLP